MAMDNINNIMRGYKAKLSILLAANMPKTFSINYNHNRLYIAVNYNKINGRLISS